MLLLLLVLVVVVLVVVVVVVVINSFYFVLFQTFLLTVTLASEKPSLLIDGDEFPWDCAGGVQRFHWLELRGLACIQH